MSRDQRCDAYNEMLSAYLDGELTTTERTELLQHLATCFECRSRLDEYRSIGTRIRGLTPVSVPEELTAAIYMHTVDAPPRRMLLLTNRIAYPAAAIAAVLLVFIVAVFLLVDGYQRSIDPTIVGSSPTNQIMWNYTDAVRITFNKEMNRQSVEAALTIIPTSERDRLQLSWEGNTLVIGGNATLRPGTSYNIGVTTEARDKWGNRLSEPFALGFTTSASVSLHEPVAVPTPSATPTPDIAPAIVATPEPAPPTVTPEQQQQPQPPPPDTPTPVPSDPGNSTADNPPPDDNNDSQEPAPPPPPPPVEVEPSPTPEPPPTETPVPPVEVEPTPVPPTEVPDPTATSEPEPTATPVTPTATPEPEPTPSPTPDTVAVTGAFGNVYWRNETVQDRLGAPEAPEYTAGVLELDFQRGKMILIPETGQVLIMQTWGTWELVPDIAAEELPEFVEIDEAGLWEPGGILGYVWQSDPMYLETLGYAVDNETHEYESLFQSFDGGRMIYSPEGFIYVLYAEDATWELYPDTGPLGDTSSVDEP